MFPPCAPFFRRAVARVRRASGGKAATRKGDDKLLVVRRLLCSVRRGHRWKTTLDAAGSITSCARCGTLRHGRTESVKDGSFKAHVNLAADFPRLRSHGPEELKVGDED